MNRPRHIVFVHQVYSTANAEGSGRANAIAEAMVRSGYRVSIVAGANSYLTGELPERYRGRWITVEACDGYDVYRPWTYTKMHKSFFHRALYFVVYMCTSAWTLTRLPTFDVIVGCSPPITVAVAACFAALLRRKPFVFEVRDLWPAFPIQMGVIRNRAVVAISRVVERFLYRRACRVVINSPGFTPYLGETGVDLTRVSLVPNGVDIDAFRPLEPDAALRSSLGLDGKFMVLYIGAHGPANALHRLLDVAAIMKENRSVQFVLIGAGKEKSDLEGRAAAEGLSNVTFLQPRPKDDIPRYIALADLCYASLQNIPMFTTTYPNKVFDYMACGKPTLTTIDGVSRTVLEEAGAGIYVGHADTASIAAQIEWARSHGAELARMGQAGRARAVAEWDRRRFADAFARLMDEVPSR
jgi:glycosyltransferase involved in cell wall biosynthesis